MGRSISTPFRLSFTVSNLAVLYRNERSRQAATSVQLGTSQGSGTADPRAHPRRGCRALRRARVRRDDRSRRSRSTPPPLPRPCTRRSGRRRRCSGRSCGGRREAATTRRSSTRKVRDGSRQPARSASSSSSSPRTSAGASPAPDRCCRSSRARLPASPRSPSCTSASTPPGSPTCAAFPHSSRRNGPLRVDDDVAAETVWALTSPELYVLLTGVRGWSRERYAAWLADSLRALLSGQEGAPRATPGHAP